MCGKSVPISSLIIWINKDETINTAICQNCYNNIGNCATCTYNEVCNFETDHSEPHYVMQTVQQGFMTMQKQVKNPHLVEKHCISCRCSTDGKGTCMREENGTNCGCWNARMS